MPWKINKLIMYKLTSYILGLSLLSHSLSMPLWYKFNWKHSSLRQLEFGFCWFIPDALHGRITSKSRKRAFSLKVFLLLQIRKLILKGYGMQKLVNSILPLGLNRISLRVLKNKTTSLCKEHWLSTLHARDLSEKSRCNKYISAQLVHYTSSIKLFCMLLFSVLGTI